MKRKVKKMLYFLLILSAVFLSFRIKMKWEAHSKVFNLESLPPNRPASIALILGAGVKENGEASLVLKDRVATGVNLYRSGRVQFLLMSGDNRPGHLYETDVMKKLAMDEGLSSEAILVDPQGYRTFESCRNLKRHQNSGDVFVVSQAFHLDRALYICKELGVEAIGVKADLSPYSLSSRIWWQLREIPASFKAWWDARK